MSGLANLPVRFVQSSEAGGGVRLGVTLQAWSPLGSADVRRLRVERSGSAATMVETGIVDVVYDALGAFGGNLPVGTRVIYASINGTMVLIGWVCRT